MSFRYIGALGSFQRVVMIRNEWKGPRSTKDPSLSTCEGSIQHICDQVSNIHKHWQVAQKELLISTHSNEIKPCSTTSPPPKFSPS